MNLEYRSLAGIDVHKRMLAVVVRIPDNAECRYVERKFGTSVAEIEHVAAFLQSYQVAEVVMESTAQYWRPVWYGLEAHFALHLVNPLTVRAQPGRKRDFADAQRLVNRLASGDLVESFVPADEQRRWRSLTRMRVDSKRKLSRVNSQVEGLLEEARIKLSSVVSDLFGATGWAILQELGRGESRPEVLAEQARGSLQNKKPQLQEALAGRMHADHRLLLNLYLGQAQLLIEQAKQLDRAIAGSMREHAAALYRLCRIPGVDMTAAEDLLAEIGPGAVHFVTPERLASWTGMCPGSNESAGINHSTRTANGNRFLRRIMCQIAWAASRTKGSFFQGLFQRLVTRLGPQSAVWAVGHRILKLIWRVLQHQTEYKERGPVSQNPSNLARKFRRLANQLRSAGLDPLTLLPLAQK